MIHSSFHRFFAWQAVTFLCMVRDQVEDRILLMAGQDDPQDDPSRERIHIPPKREVGTNHHRKGPLKVRDFL